MSLFEENEWEELEPGTLGEGPSPTGNPDDNFIVTGLAHATHRRYKNRRTGETLIIRRRDRTTPDD